MHLQCQRSFNYLEFYIMASRCQHSIQLPHITKTLTIILILCTIMLQVTCTCFTPNNTLAQYEGTCSSQTTLADSDLGCSNLTCDSCLFYANCREARYHCGPPGYPVGYGAKFCPKFSDDCAQMSARGQTWMFDAMQCLQRALVPEATGTKAGVTCGSIKTEAFGTHTGCYVGSGHWAVQAFAI